MPYLFTQTCLSAKCMCLKPYSCLFSSSLGHWEALPFGEWLYWSRECVWSPCSHRKCPAELLPSRDTQVPLPPLQWWHSPPPGPVGVQHWGTSAASPGHHSVMTAKWLMVFLVDYFMFQYLNVCFTYSLRTLFVIIVLHAWLLINDIG